MKNQFLTPEFEKQLIEVCNQNLSMAKACVIMNMNHNTFIKHAKRLNCYRPNQSGKGMPGESKPLYPLAEVLTGKHPELQSSKLRTRLLKEGVKEHKCEKCGNTEWLGKPIPLELHHKDGDHHNHLLENLEILCPNCHSLTPNHSKKH